MASFSCSSFSLILLPYFLVVFFPFQYSSIFVSCDDALINTVCSKTVEPVVCSECLKSDPKSTSTDARGLAEIAIHCAETDTTLLHNDTYEYSKKTGDGALKELLINCAVRFYDARDDFTGVLQNVDYGVYDVAKAIVANQILPSIDYCVEEFEKHPELPLPPNLLSGTAIVKQLCGVVTGIINYLIG